MLQGRDRLARFRAHRVLKAHGAQHGVAVDHVEHRRAPVPPGSRGGGQCRGFVRPHFPEQGGTAHQDRPAADRGADAAAGQGGETARLRDREPAPAGGRHDRAGQRVLAVRFRRSGQREQLVPVGPFGGSDVLEFRLAPGQGPGLVEQHDVDRPHPLERHPVLDQHAGPGCPFRGDRDDQRDGEAQGVRAGDHQHRHGALDGVGHAAQQRPGDKGDDARPGGEVEQEGGGAVGEGLGPRGGGLGLGHEPLDAGEGGVVADGCHPDAEAVVRGDGSRDHGVAGGAQDGLGLAGDHRFVEFGLPLDHGSVRRHPGAGPDQDRCRRS